MRFVLVLLLVLVVAPLSAADLWVAVGDSGLRMTSTDGEKWQLPQTWSNTQDPLTGIAFGLNRFIAVGGTDQTGHLLASSDGASWHDLHAVPKKISAIAFGQNRFVATQGPQLLVSIDGETFTSGDRLEIKVPARAIQIACGDTEAGFRFVVIGESAPFPAAPLDYWRAVTSDGTRIDSFAPQPRATSIAYGAGHFVVVGRDRIESSHDGEIWQLQPCPGDLFTSVVWTGTRFIATTDGAIWTSADALAWRRQKTYDPRPILWARETPTPLGVGLTPAGLLAITHDFQSWKIIQPETPRVRAIALGKTQE